MMLIRHKNPGYAGDVVIATRLLSFADGVAEADLSSAQAAAVKAKGHAVDTVENKAEDATPAIDTPTRPTELGDDVELDAKPTEMYDYLPGDATP